ncbi:hypothetical protein AURDEDRAFT_174253 [Auricularia subglabra TFB-10046 SS5]|uniref:Activator of Hsp90 ATPase homologue 1/2-like C-terminal domain-containing protein n=1 Tax=Auricularia subglabra (strain TFB-10046 / SS5) TaxID=717982 RepID=J0D9S5_AURST|nr:hypothetical protein AURDEDRAFT_174253 [Auricularia subglabra TFB-10046 SS5]
MRFLISAALALLVAMAVADPLPGLIKRDCETATCPDLLNIGNVLDCVLSNVLDPPAIAICINGLVGTTLPLPSTRMCVPINFTSLQHLSTTVDIAESLLKNDQCNPQLRSMVLHAKVRNIAFPSCPFYTILAAKCASLQSLCLVDWAPPAYNDESLPPAAPHHGLRTLGIYLTYCYCVADMTCPHGAFVWEGFVGAVAPVFPNIEVLQYPCAPESGGVEDREHLPSHMSLTTWKAPRGYAKHLPRLHTVRLGNGLMYSRNEGGEFTLAHAGNLLEPPFIGIPRPLHPWIHLVKELPVARELASAAWIDPAPLRWFSNPSTPTSEPISVDARPGCVWRQRMLINDKTDYVTGGVYKDIVAPVRVVFVWGAENGWPNLKDNLVAEVTFEELKDQAQVATRMTFKMTRLPDDWEDKDVNQCHGGWTETLARFVPAART